MSLPTIVLSIGLLMLFISILLIINIFKKGERVYTEWELKEKDNNQDIENY